MKSRQDVVYDLMWEMRGDRQERQHQSFVPGKLQNGHFTHSLDPYCVYF